MTSGDKPFPASTPAFGTPESDRWLHKGYLVLAVALCLLALTLPFIVTTSSTQSCDRTALGDVTACSD